jgi:hypothetical protein
MVCAHAAQIQEVEPTADGCEDCLKRGDDWVHLRLCLSSGHVGCCDDSKNKHATKHFRDAEHPIIQSFAPGEDWRRASSTRSSWSSGEEPLDHDEERRRQRMSQDNEKLVRAFYEATVPDHRERLWALQAPHVVYKMPEGMPFGCGHFEGLEDILERFLTSFYGALDVRFVAEEFIAARETVVAIGRIEGATRNTRVPVNVAFSPTYGRFARDVSNGCGRSPIRLC